MKKQFTLFTFIFSFFFVTQKVAAQTYPPPVLVYGVYPFGDSLWAFDTTNLVPFQKVLFANATLAGYTITGVNGIAFDPCEFKSYVILKVTVGSRRLAIINLTNGVCTDVGSLGDNFATICFDRTGQLWGVTGDGALVPETLYMINKANASVTLATALGNGLDGEVISYNTWDNRFFHWSGNGTVEYEKFLAGAPYTVTPVTSGPPFGEIFGALCLETNKFLVTDINGFFEYVDTLGNFSAGFAGQTDDIRGITMPPAFAISNDTVCAGYGILNVGAIGVNAYDVYYHWGDGNADTVTAGGSTHIYSTVGTYTLTVILNNGYCPPDTIWTTTVVVGPCTGIEENSSSITITVSPNPFSDGFTVSTLIETIDEITLVNALGEKLRNWKNITSRQLLKAGDLPAGVYLLQVKTENGTAVKKLVRN